MAQEGVPSLVCYPVVGKGLPAFKALHAFDISRSFEFAEVDAEVSVGCLDAVPEFDERSFGNAQQISERGKTYPCMNDLVKQLMIEILFLFRGVGDHYIFGGWWLMPVPGIYFEAQSTFFIALPQGRTMRIIKFGTAAGSPNPNTNRRL